MSVALIELACVCGYTICNCKEILKILLPPAYVVRGKVIFILGNVCLFTIGEGGYPVPGLGGEYPMPGLGGGYPITGLGGGVPCPRSGEVHHPRSGSGVPWGAPLARSEWWGVPPPTTIMTGWGTPTMTRWDTPPQLAGTCYAAGGMPLAFTREDFLVGEKYTSTRTKSYRSALFCRSSSITS